MYCFSFLYLIVLLIRYEFRKLYYKREGLTMESAERFALQWEAAMSRSHEQCTDGASASDEVDSGDDLGSPRSPAACPDP